MQNAVLRSSLPSTAGPLRSPQRSRFGNLRPRSNDALAGVQFTLRALDACGVPALICQLDGQIAYTSACARSALEPHDSTDFYSTVQEIVRDLRDDGDVMASVHRTVQFPPSTFGVRSAELKISRLAVRGAEWLVVITPALETALTDDAMTWRRSERYAQLTVRERQVADLIAQGHSGAEMARLLAISMHTVRRHTERIFAKYGVQTRARLMAELQR